jgi:hypothetical protein
MSASVTYNCRYCAKVDKCKDKSKDLYKDGGHCFASKKTVENLALYTFGKKRGRKKLIKKTEEPENANA